LIDYYAAVKMAKIAEKQKRKKFVILSLCANLGLLFSFKYLNFFSESTRSIFNHFNIFVNIPTFNILLPVGISFYTFQTLSYTIDVYKGKLNAEKHLGIFALYVSFFPQLVAGPIERSSRLLPQFYKKFDFDYNNVTNGLKLIVWGLFKKMVVADRLAILVDKIYNNPSHYNGISFLIATFFFSFQIYCDFSGYSDIAIGAAQTMGYKLMDNFFRPYHSKSISEFWRRWHISLSTWFRDYLYIPLGGNKVTKIRWYYNILITFLISGLWHGANWTFVVWGGLHGFYMLFGDWTKNIRQKLVSISGLEKFPSALKYLRLIITFSLVCFAWIFFRAKNITDAFYIAKHLFLDTGRIIAYLNCKMMRETFYSWHSPEAIISILAIGFMEIIHIIQRHHSIRQMLSERPIWFRWGTYLFLVLSILNFGVVEKVPFIYFQF
jgi:D-alanyl-lipoteichoic acid acyltransferase DltB (MBOAT superfamily)